MQHNINDEAVWTLEKMALELDWTGVYDLSLYSMDRLAKDLDYWRAGELGLFVCAY